MGKGLKYPDSFANRLYGWLPTRNANNLFATKYSPLKQNLFDKMQTREVAGILMEDYGVQNYIPHLFSYPWSISQERNHLSK